MREIIERQTETTIHDIAKKLDTAASTVSRALKDNPLISEKTREQIKKLLWKWVTAQIV